MATTAATMSNVVGQMFFLAISPLVVTTPDQLPTLWLVQLVPNVALAACMAAFLQDRPPTAPSSAAAQQWRDRAEAAEKPAALWCGLDTSAARKLFSDVSALFASRSFCFLAASFAIATGTVWAVLILEAQLLLPCGYSNATAGAAAAALLGVGVVAAFAVSTVLERTRKYVELQRGVMLAALVATIATFASLRPNALPLLLVSWCLLGATLQPLMPLSLEHAAEMTFPVDAQASTAALFIAANAFGFILVLILGAMLGEPGGAACPAGVTPAAGTAVGLMAAGAALTLGVEEDYRRSGAEAQGLLA